MSSKSTDKVDSHRVWSPPLSTDVTSVPAGSGFSLMQHLIDEMEKSSQRIDLFSSDQYAGAGVDRTDHRQLDLLYDDAWKSEESDAASLYEVPVNYLGKENEDSGCEDAVTSAIAEVSKDFLSGLRTGSAPNHYGDSDESRMSSDTEFKLLKGMASYARYPETAAGLSDNDWNPYGTESDTNVSPRVSSHDGSGPMLSDATKYSSVTSFSPPLHSTDLNVNTPSTLMYSIPDTAARRGNVQEETHKDTVFSLKPDVTADFSTISHVSEQTLSPHKSFRDPVTMSLLNKTMRGPELETENSAKGLVNGYEKVKEVVDVDLKARLPDQENKQMTASTSSTGYSSVARSHESQPKEREMGLRQRNSHYMLDMERAKSLGIANDVVDGTAVIGSEAQNVSHEEKNDDSRDGLSRKYEPTPGYISDDEYLGQKVQKVLSDTQYLAKTGDKRRSFTNVAVDYKMLQADLQEIQDSLHHALGPEARQIVNGQGKSPITSEDEREIIPSTTTTPERRRNKMAWDFAADLDYQQAAGLMGDISLDTLITNSQRPSEEKKSYNSDGDETRTSGSSDKLEDHAAADQAMAEMSEILNPSAKCLRSNRDVDQVLSTFRHQRRQIESRYHQLNNQGLAEKVYRILTNQDPESQANGILSEVSAEERELKARYALSLHNKDFNFSTNSASMDESNHSLALPDEVRKRLDLSGLSSTEASRLADKSSLHMPFTSKGFTAFEDMTKFLSSQMTRASERTFNQSLEMRVPPQVVQCYPLFADKEGQEKKDGKTNGERTPNSSADTQMLQATGTANQLQEKKSPETSAEETSERATKIDPEIDRPASTSSPKEFIPEQRDTGNYSPPSAEDSDTSSEKRREKYRPYRPAGSKEVYYTESDAASVADSVTTMESTHMGSDDARGPSLPTSVLGSRKDPPNAVGIYGNRKPLSSVQEGQSLPSIQEKSGIEECEVENAQSNKGGKDSENTRLAGKSTTDKGGNAGGQLSDNSSGKKDTNVKGRLSNAQDEGISINVRSEFTASGTDMPSSHSVTAARRNAKWANRATEEQGNYQQEPWRRAHRSDDTNENAGMWDTGASDLNRRERMRSYLDTDFRWDKNRRSHDHYSLPTDYTAAARTDDARDSEPLSLRIQMMYNDDKSRSDQETSEKHRYRQGFDNRRWTAYTTEDVAVPSSGTRSDDYPTSAERLYRGRFRDNDQPLSRQFDQPSSPLRQHYQTQRDRILPRSHSDEDLSSPVRDARLSSAFHRALSPELRLAIENRSPVLSRHIERSLAQPPADYSDQRRREIVRDRDFARSLSPPPTFLARERGWSSREFERMPVSGRRSPLSSSRRERSWSPSLQARSMSPSFMQVNHLEQRNLAGSPTERKTPVFNERAKKEKVDSWDRKTASSPKRQVELTLENMSSESDDTERDLEPISKRAQLLTQALTQKQEPDIPPNINALWEQFKAVNESYDSSMNSSRMEAVADLLRNPSRHLIAEYLKEREEYRIERQERAEVERETRLKEQQLQQQLRNSRLSSSEEELSGSYAELLAKKEEERLKRRMSRKKKGKLADAMRPTPGGEEAKNSENVPDSLFSIPEDASFEQSPVKPSSASKPQKPKVSRQQHVIDPNMNKLRERISKQRRKIDKNTLKELQRMEKLKKLEHLLSAKKQGQISDQTLERQLDEISSTSTPGSDNSHDGTDKNVSAHNTTPLSDDSTTAKDSSAEMHAWKAEKERRIKVMKAMEKERGKEARQVRPSMDKNNAHVRRGAPDERTGVRRQEMANSQIKLLHLVKEGYLTPEEAYRLALERAAGSEESPKSSSDDVSVSQTSRLHRLYSPYARQDYVHNLKAYHVPKLKYTSSTHDVDIGGHRLPQYRRDMEQGMKSRLAWPDHNDSQESDSHGYDNSRAARPTQFKSRPLNSKERQPSSIPVSPGSVQRSRQAPRRSSPSQRDRWTSPSRQSTSRQQHHISPSRPRDVGSRSYSSSPPRKGKKSPHRHFNKQGRCHGSGSLEKMNYRSENDPPHKQESPSSGGVAWHIPMDLHPGQWKEPTPQTKQKLPLQEKKMVSNKQHSRKPVKLPAPAPMNEDVEPLQGWQRGGGDSDEGIWHKSDHPQGIPHELWAHIVQHDALASKTNHWDVDPLLDKVQYILNKPSGESGTNDGTDKESDDVWDEKPVSKMSLQEAFLARKQSFISKCRERQKRLALSRENRHMQECLRLEREAIFMDQDRQPNGYVNAHPYSDNLYQPKRRVFSKQEMKEMTLKRYVKLPEVVKKKESDKRSAECKLNRLRVRIFNKKVQREVLRKKATMRHR